MWKVFYTLSKNSAGENLESKIYKVIKNLKNIGADYQFISSSENNARLFNIRGKDSKYSPIPHCYALVEKNSKIKFFCDLKKTSLSFRKKLKKIKFFEIKYAESVLSKINKKSFLVDNNSCSMFFEQKVLSVIFSPLKLFTKSASKIVQLRKKVETSYIKYSERIVIIPLIQDEKRLFLHQEMYLL